MYHRYEWFGGRGQLKIASLICSPISLCFFAYSRTGAIFTEDQKDSPMELAFKYAVYRINKDKNMLPKTTLVYDIQYVPKDDSFRTSKKGMHQSIANARSQTANRVKVFAGKIWMLDGDWCLYVNVPPFASMEWRIELSHPETWFIVRIMGEIAWKHF